MIVMKVELDNLYGFHDFKIDFSYPKKIVNSTIPNEYLSGRPRFRYKKAVVLMGANATGKTTLGRALLRFFKFIETENPSYLVIGENNGLCRISVDFVNNDYYLHRVEMQKTALARDEYRISHKVAFIAPEDSYESSVSKLKDAANTGFSELKNSVGQITSYFALEDDISLFDTSSIDQKLFLKVLKAIIGTLDPSLSDIEKIDNVEDSYVIKRGSQEIIIQKGKITNKHLLSSGTIRGIDIAILLSQVMSNKTGFYYCDEHFSYIQTDLEKRIFAIMLDYLDENEQLIFTTHNLDMLELNLPKHSFAFLGREGSSDYLSRIMFASERIKRNTDSVRCAAVNDLFSWLPDESLLDSLSPNYD